MGAWLVIFVPKTKDAVVTVDHRGSQRPSAQGFSSQLRESADGKVVVIDFAQEVAQGPKYEATFE
jgi:hypothetical protein